MKKFLLCMLLAGLMMPVVAQEKVALKQNEKRVVMNRKDAGGPTQEMLPTTRGTLVEVGLWKSAGISADYDRQSQGGVYPMTQIHKDREFIGCTWTNEDNPHFGSGNTPFRGVGYSYSTDGGQTWSWNDEEKRENRLGGIPVYWPSYAQWGKNGEAVMARSYDSYEYNDGYNDVYIKDGMVLFTRENRGEGAWTITPVPYPEGADPVIDNSKYFMAWGSMTTSGEDNQYIQIITPMSTEDSNIPYHEYKTPLLYYRTQDGKTWEVEGEVVPEMVGQDWGEESYFSDALSFAVQGNTIACSFVNWGNHGYVIRSYDNGDNWECIKFFDSPVRGELTPNDYADTVNIPVIGSLALDNDGKMHVAFAVVLSTNDEQSGYIGYWSYIGASFLSYWNEDMGPIDGEKDFRIDVIDPILWESGTCMNWDLSEPDNNLWYVESIIPKWPIIGYPTPLSEGQHTVVMDGSWATTGYGVCGCFSFPQMVFDANNVLHLVYLGLLDNGNDRRHPFYTTTADRGETWTQTEYLVNYVGVVDQEFAYPVLAGVSADDEMLMMAQTDPYPGVSTAYNGHTADHGAVDNRYTFFAIAGVDCPDCPESIPSIEYTPLTMQLFPNPASGQVKVTFEGKGDITVYNMLGQTVYRVENVENAENGKDIPLNMASGVYFVTVRSGNAMATQKLVVK